MAYDFGILNGEPFLLDHEGDKIAQCFDPEMASFLADQLNDLLALRDAVTHLMYPRAGRSEADFKALVAAYEKVK